MQKTNKAQTFKINKKSNRNLSKQKNTTEQRTEEQNAEHSVKETQGLNTRDRTTRHR